MYGRKRRAKYKSAYLRKMRNSQKGKHTIVEQLVNNSRRIITRVMKIAKLTQMSLPYNSIKALNSNQVTKELCLNLKIFIIKNSNSNEKKIGLQKMTL